MAKKRPGMMIYFADWDGVADLLTPEQFKRLFLAVMHASMGEATESLDDDKALALAYRLIQGKMERDAEKYDAVCERRRAAAGKRWSQKNGPALQQDEMQEDANACFAMQTMPTVTVNPTVNPTVTVNPTLSPQPLSANDQAQSSDTAPETEREIPKERDVLKYAKEAGYSEIDKAMARRFIVSQAAKGWNDSNGQPIRNWRTWFDGWLSRERAAPGSATAKPVPTSMQYGQRSYSDDDIARLTDFMEGG